LVCIGHNNCELFTEEEFKDSKGVIRICKSEEQTTQEKIQKDNDLQNMHINLKIK